jgi:general secretion pathway protein E
MSALDPVFKRCRLEYGLAGLLPLLEQVGELRPEQVRLVRARAEEHNISEQDPKGLDLLVRLGLLRAKKRTERVTEEVVLRAVGGVYGLKFKRVDPLELDLDVSTGIISESFARKHRMVPLRIQDGCLEVLVHNPFQPGLWEDMERASSLPCRVHLGTRRDIDRLIDDFYQFRQSIRAAEREFARAGELDSLEGRVTVATKSDPTSQRHIIEAADYLLRSALRERASDIHLEPKRDRALVRFRIDGAMHTLYRLPLSVHQAVLNRFKGMSRLDIAEKRRPQDGRVQLVLQGLPTDVRVSTVPVAFGEKMVLRLLSSETTLKSLSGLGMTPGQERTYRSMTGRSHGLVLLTGPTGSGKSTTLYSTLKLLAAPTINVVTLEDPIEMVMEDFNQIGVQTRIGVSFGQMLRHILRQDPDVIMIGEMRDLETAQEAVQAALTGHLVLSTLHTNDAASALTRLQDLGVDSYLINASLVGCVAQRLVRTICPRCRVEQELDEATILRLGAGEYFEPGDTVFRGAGCEHCRRTGFRGRSGIFEMMEFSGRIQEAVRAGVELDQLRSLVRADGTRSLFADGMDRVKRGVTTLEEVVRVAGTGSSF